MSSLTRKESRECVTYFCRRRELNIAANQNYFSRILRIIPETYKRKRVRQHGNHSIMVIMQGTDLERILLNASAPVHRSSLDDSNHNV